MTWFQPFLGGAMIGAAVSLMLLFNGRICGNSGIIGSALKRLKPADRWRIYYIGGLFLGGVLYRALDPSFYVTVEAEAPIIVLGGLLVGYGTRVGGGCTSGHGICGVSRVSKRSITATILFMATAILTRWLVTFWGA